MKHNENTRNLLSELDWLDRWCCFRINCQISGQPEGRFDLTPPEITPYHSTYGHFVIEQWLTLEERLIVSLCLAPYLQPKLLNKIANQSEYAPPFRLRATTDGMGYLPTVETALYLLAGDDPAKRYQISELFNQDHFLRRDGIIEISPAQPYESLYGGVLHLADGFRESFLWNKGHLLAS